ncbi:serine hydrolase [Acinetobacter nosocomialis]|uniref:Serine hydrolase n=1 Tax=Acinetobacter nosocomialis TaxID=106654 RepID=A0A2L1VI50_ACINO|nr:serine hydrolase [Acinetobacter nosocomialis]ARG17519.1 serine hydrolase [Acinetobacter nosocomialis]AVF44791.1 serine hydrolase [Acinetobacter nosocomialis]MBM9551914.1 serine hydrolase [Acinetobacter nosocomialis]MBP1469812.1 serine hydrolase [Acinetobacter nosocomialis]MBP1500236.1 serine hydrolase [Acinetobacter nosocomialis]
MKNFLTKKMYASRALFFAVGVMALNVSPIVVSTAHAAAEQKIDTLSSKLSSIFADKPIEASLFSSQFLGQVSITQIQKIVDDLKVSLGTLKSINVSNGSGTIDFEKGELPVSISLDQQGQISTLWFSAPHFKTVSLDETVKGLHENAVGKTSLLVVVDNKPVVVENDKTPMAVGSTFKLLVLKAYEDAIKKGELKRETIVSLKEKNRSLPTGVLQNLPAGTPVNLELLAQLMIQISDNTATDSLIEVLKKPRIEALSPRNSPMLTTGELFQLIDSSNEQLRNKFKTGTKSARLEVLSELDKLPLPSVSSIGKSATWQDAEWYMSANEICPLLESVQNAPALNSSLNPLFKNLNWQKIGFKGGSEYGVINFSVIGNTQKGHKVCAVFTANGNEPQPESKLAILFTSLLQAVDSINP